MAVANADAERRAANAVVEINNQISELKGQLSQLETKLAAAQKSMNDWLISPVSCRHLWR